jgi:hypothetical protein
MSLSSRTCRELGVFLLACAFHGPAETTTLTISHPDSDIRSIVIPAGGLTLTDLPVGLSMVPFALLYLPDRNEKASMDVRLLLHARPPAAGAE